MLQVGQASPHYVSYHSMSSDKDPHLATYSGGQPLPIQSLLHSCYFTEWKSELLLVATAMLVNVTTGSAQLLGGSSESKEGTWFHHHVDLIFLSFKMQYIMAEIHFSCGPRLRFK